MITVLAFGGGQDSTAILYKLALEPRFYKKYVKGRLIVIMCDTGDEHSSTYHHIRFIKQFCKQRDIEFHFIQSAQGFHPRQWPGLLQWMKKYDGIISKAYPKTCTDNLKIKPFYNFLDNLIGKQYFHQDIHHTKSRKSFIKKYALENGKIHVLLGITHGEENRRAKSFPHIWMTKSLLRIYPLIEEGMNRSNCQDYILSTGLPLPPPSNCMRCPFLSAIELVWLYRFHPDKLHEWEQREQAKISKWRRLGLPNEKNLGVFGHKLLPESLQMALRLYGHLTSEQLHEYKMSHGHCVMSKY